MKKYAIWNKQDPILTPIGEVLTASQWIQRYPMAGLNNITVICSAGEINGGFFGTLGQMVQMYEAQGCDFSECETPEAKLEAIEAFEDARDAAAREAANNAKSTEERQTTALEAIASGATAESTAAMNALLTGEE